MILIGNDNTGHCVDGTVHGAWTSPCQCHQAHPYHVHQGHFYDHLLQGFLKDNLYQGFF